MTTTASTTSAGGDRDEEHHIAPARTFVKVLIALMLLTGLTVYTARQVDLGEFGNLALALLIASFKASLVVAFFMHLRWDKPLNTLILFFCLTTVGLFLALTMTDLKGRDAVDPIRAGPIEQPNQVEQARQAAVAAGEAGHGAEQGDDAAEQP